MRYGEQVFEVPVDLDGIDLAAPDLLSRIAERFHARHEALYTYALRDQDATVVNLRLAAIGVLPAMPVEPPLASRAASAPRARRKIWWQGAHEVPVFDLDVLAVGQVVIGPAIVESSTTTVLLHDGDCATTTPLGWLDLSVALGTRARQA
jgi:N-methylhydantoinase A